MSSDGGRFRLRVWGARGSTPVSGVSFNRYGGNTACVSVEAEDGPLIALDAGTGIRALGSHLSADDERKEVHLLLTHRHSDHVIGLPHFAPLHSGNPSVVLRCGNANRAATRDTLQRLWSPPLFPGHPETAATIRFEDFDPTGATSLATDVIVENLTARHPGNAAILVVGDSDGPAIAYAPDNELGYENKHRAIEAWRTSLIESLRNIPVLIHDAMYRDEELESHAGWGHSSASEATRFAIECRAGTLLLFHHHPDRTDSEIDAIVETCRAQADSAGSDLRIVAADEGFTLSVEHRSRHHRGFQS